MNETIADVQRSGNEVSLRFPYERFQEFIFGFLRNRETLKKEYDVDFVVDLADLVQFHHLLSQKTDQNRFISPQSFEVVIAFDDKTSRTLYGLEALESFVETRDIGVNSISLNWTFLRQKDENDVPQKQTVSILFDTIISMVRPGVREPVIRNLGKIEVKIEHTDPIWSGEVLNHFENKIAGINSNYSWIYRVCRFLKQYRYLHKLVLWLTVLSIIGVVYLSVQWTDLTSPATTKREVYYDLADVLNKEELGPAVKADTPEDLIKRVQLYDQKLVLDYFVIRDLVNAEDVGVLRSLSEKKYFHKAFEPVITRILEGYYNDKTKSETLVATVDAQLRAEKASNNIRFAYNYLRWALLIIFLYLAGGLYLRIFANKSIIAITEKGKKIRSNQEKWKADYLQIIYGVMATFLAAGIAFFLQLISF